MSSYKNLLLVLQKDQSKCQESESSKSQPIHLERRSRSLTPLAHLLLKGKTTSSASGELDGEKLWKFLTSKDFLNAERSQTATAQGQQSDVGPNHRPRRETKETIKQNDSTPPEKKRKSRLSNGNSSSTRIDIVDNRTDEPVRQNKTSLGLHQRMAAQLMADKRPKRVSSTVNERAICDWQMIPKCKKNRYPSILMEAECGQCEKCREIGKVPERVFYHVLVVRISEDGRKQHKFGFERIPVACVCVDDVRKADDYYNDDDQHC